MDTKKYSEAVRNGATDENNKYWQDVEWKINKENGNATISFSMDDLERQLLIYETVSSSYNGATSKIYRENLTIDTQNATKIDKDNISTSGTISYTANGDSFSMFTDGEAEWNVTDNVGTATYKNQIGSCRMLSPGEPSPVQETNCLHAAILPRLCLESGNPY